MRAFKAILCFYTNVYFIFINIQYLCVNAYVGDYTLGIQLNETLTVTNLVYSNEKDGCFIGKPRNLVVNINPHEYQYNGPQVLDTEFTGRKVCQWLYDLETEHNSRKADWEIAQKLKRKKISWYNLFRRTREYFRRFPGFKVEYQIRYIDIYHKDYYHNPLPWAEISLKYKCPQGHEGNEVFDDLCPLQYSDHYMPYQKHKNHQHDVHRNIPPYPIHDTMPQYPMQNTHHTNIHYPIHTTLKEHMLHYIQHHNHHNKAYMIILLSPPVTYNQPINFDKGNSIHYLMGLKSAFLTRNKRGVSFAGNDDERFSFSTLIAMSDSIMGIGGKLTDFWKRGDACYFLPFLQIEWEFDESLCDNIIHEMDKGGFFEALKSEVLSSVQVYVRRIDLMSNPMITLYGAITEGILTNKLHRFGIAMYLDTNPQNPADMKIVQNSVRVGRAMKSVVHAFQDSTPSTGINIHFNVGGSKTTTTSSSPPSYGWNMNYIRGNTTTAAPSDYGWYYGGYTGSTTPSPF